jgi:hypothetical protein
MNKITKPGVYDLPLEEYLGQCTDGWSFSSSDAQVVAGLEPLTPAHLRARWAEPRERARNAEFGTAVHCMVLEPSRAASQVVIIDADNYKKPANAALADAAIAAGKTPLLADTYERAKRVADKVLSHPRISKWLSAGIAEQSFFAKDPRGIYLKARPDFFTRDRIILDLKSVGSTSDKFIKNRITDGGWFMQAPWYCDVVERLEGELPEDYYWVCIEQDEPHAIRIIQPPAGTLAAGARENERALAILAKCASTNEWPEYADVIETRIGLHDFAHYRLEEFALPAPGMEAARFARELATNPFG